MYKVHVTPLSDEDVERIARRVVWKLIAYVLLILAVLWIAQYVVFALVALFTSGTSVYIVLLPLATALLAVPLVLLLWIWRQSRRSP